MAWCWSPVALRTLDPHVALVSPTCDANPRFAQEASTSILSRRNPNNGRAGEATEGL